MMETESKKQISRRGFLAAVGAAGAALLVKPATSVAATASDEDFLSGIKSSVGDRFILHLPHGRAAARLERIEENRACARLHQFTCHFTVEGNGNEELPQQVYVLESKALGRMDLLMLPGNEGPTRSLVATFGQLV